jgi:hypothetical protein
MKNLSLGSLFKPLGRLFGRFHMTLFIVFIVACLTFAVVTLNSILAFTSVSDGYTSPIDAGTIDQTTLDRIKELHTSDEAVPALVLPAGRLNPFAE